MSPTLAFLLGLLVASAVVWAAHRYLSFRAQRPEDYAAQTPVLDIRERLNGPILCEGVIYGPTGKISSRFVADFDAKWDGDSGVMTEHFRYAGGTTQDREWTLTLNPDGTIKAEAPDLVGPGSGRQSGDSVLLNYRIRLPESSGGHVLDVTDWMYLMENGTIMNRSQFRKFGIKVAELVATMRPAPAQAVEAQAQPKDNRAA
jgi:hypothetical protein